MINIEVKVGIHNPEIQDTISVPQFSSLEEAIEIYGGEDKILDIINRHVVYLNRQKWNERIIKELLEKSEIKGG